MRILATLAICAVLLSAPHAFAQNEAEMQDFLCVGWEQEVRTQSGARIDCVNKTHAIEIDWASNWAEAIGQSLHYAEETGLLPGIILICRDVDSSCTSFSLRLDVSLTYWQIPAQVWYCTIESRTLEDCVPRNYCTYNTCAH